MQQHLCLVTIGDRQKVIDKSLIVDGKIKVSHWQENYEHEDGGYHINDWMPVEIDKEFVLIVLADFILKHVTRSEPDAFTSRANRGMRDSNGLVYAYSVTIIEKLGEHQLWDSMIVHTESGVKTTRFDMYSYHFNNPFRYISDRLPFEVMQNIQLDEILIKKEVVSE